MIRNTLRYLVLNVKDRNVLRYYKDLRRAQHIPKNEQDSAQVAKLNLLLNHSYNNVPYYREMLKESGLLVNGSINIKNQNQLNVLPMLTKNIIRNENKNLHSSDLLSRKAYRNTTGGSTGEPMVFMQDMSYLTSNLANTYLSKLWKGAEIYDKTTIIWGAERDTFEGKKPFKAKVKDYFLNTTRLNSFVLTPESIEKYVDHLNRTQPKLIIAYVQSIYAIAIYAKKNGLKVRAQNGIHAAAGTVHPFMRKEIESVFQCKVYNYYGSREAGSIASECSAHNGLHIMMDHTYVEVVDNDGRQCNPGEVGNILITTLNNFSMPLIRYQIGDIGALSEPGDCSCACNYPKLESVLGRTTDLFRTEDGSVVMPEYFIHLIGVVCNKGAIKLFQVVQEAIDRIRVIMVLETDLLDETRLEIEEKIKLVMGANCLVIFDIVNDIPKTKTGKYLYTISNIN